jgi:hypothetical protein
MALLDLGALLQAVNQNDPLQKARYDLLRRQVEAAIKSYVHWEIEQDTVTEFYDGTDYRDLYLRRPWVSFVANVWEDQQGYYGNGTSSPFSKPPLVSGNDYSLVQEDSGVGRTGLLRRLSNEFFWFPSQWIFYRKSGGLAYAKGPFWPMGQGNVKVQYTYGFVPVTPLSSASWAGGVGTFNVNGAPVLAVGQRIAIYGGPLGSPWNFTGRISSVTLAATTTFTMNMPVNPGVAAPGGLSMDGIPEDIKLACETAVSIVQNSVKYGWPVQSESLGDYNYSLAISREVEFGSVRQLLGPWRDVQVGMPW